MFNLGKLAKFIGPVMQLIQSDNPNLPAIVATILNNCSDEDLEQVKLSIVQLVHNLQAERGAHYMLRTELAPGGLDLAFTVYDRNQVADASSGAPEEVTTKYLSQLSREEIISITQKIPAGN